MNAQHGTRLLTLPQVADRLQVSVSAAYLWARQGRLRVVRLGRVARVSPDEVARIEREGIAQREQPAALGQGVRGVTIDRP